MTVSTQKLQEALESKEDLLPTIIVYTEGRERDVNMTLKGDVEIRELQDMDIDSAVAYIARCIQDDITLRTDAMQDILDSQNPYVRDVGSMFFGTPDLQDQRAEFEHDWRSIAYTVYFRILIRKRTTEYTSELKDRYAAEDTLHQAGLYLHSKRMRLIRDAVSSGEWPTHMAAAQELIRMHKEKHNTEIV